MATVLPRVWCLPAHTPPSSARLPEPPVIGANLQASQSACSVAADLTQPERDQHKVRPMTIRTESRITIASSVGAEWAPTVLECRVRGGGPLQPGSWVDQRAKDLGRTHGRSQQVTAVEAPRFVAFAGRMGTSASRWGMELEPVDDGKTDAMMWIEVDLA